MSQDEKRAALIVLRASLVDAICGGEECTGHDAQISRWIELLDIGLGNPVDPWARRYHASDIQKEMG